MIRLGTFMAARSFSVFSKPVESMSNVRDATQNHTRTEKMRNRVIPSVVIAKFMLPRLVAHIGVPAVMKSTGMEMTAANMGIKVVLAK